MLPCEGTNAIGALRRWGRRGACGEKETVWGEIYDIVLAFHLVLPTLVTMIFPKRVKFNGMKF